MKAFGENSNDTDMTVTTISASEWKLRGISTVMEILKHQELTEGVLLLMGPIVISREAAVISGIQSCRPHKS